MFISGYANTENVFYCLNNTTHKRFVIFKCRYFKLSWNTTALSQSNCRNFSCGSIRVRTHSKSWKEQRYFENLPNQIKKSNPLFRHVTPWSIKVLVETCRLEKSKKLQLTNRFYCSIFFVSNHDVWLVIRGTQRELCSRWVPLSNGNRTEWLTKLADSRPHSGSPICLITSMITDRVGRHEVLLPINHKSDLRILL